MKPWGVFEIDPTKAMRYDKNHVYLYDARNAKPFDIHFLKELEEFGKKNELHKISRKDVRQGSTLRQLLAKGDQKHFALQEIREKEEEAKNNINETIENINKKLSQTVESEEGKEQAPIEIDPNEYVSLIIDELVGKKLIDRYEGFGLKIRMIKGEMSFEEFLKKLENLKTVEINTPISMELEKIIDDFHTYQPAVVDAFIDRAEKIGEKIKKMGTPTVKNFMPIMYIFLIMIVAIVLGAVFSGLDFSNIKLPSIIPGAKFIMNLLIHG